MCIRKSPVLIVSFVVLAAAILIIVFGTIYGAKKRQPAIKVGVLHSLTGTMAISEKAVVEATLLAIEEINQKGGLLGRRIEPVIADGRSDPDVFGKEAERLITKDKVKAIFGCWTSASRKAVKPIVEKYNSLLFYPVQYEGLEASPNIVYMGAAPNQQVIPAVVWCLNNLGKRFFLVGSDYVFPRMANEIAKITLGYFGGEVAGEEYALLGSRDFAGIAEKIKQAKPDVILNTVNGDSNVAFFEALHEKKILGADLAIMSLSIGENELSAFEDHFNKLYPQDAGNFLKSHLSGTYACWNYFESINTPMNTDFIGRFRKKYGNSYRVNDPMEAAYFGVYLWSQAAAEAKDTDDPQSLLNCLYGMSVAAPEGPVTIDRFNNHARKTVRIGKLNEAGRFDILWASRHPIKPEAYPFFRSKPYWEALLEELYRRYGGHWSAGILPSGSGGRE